MALANRYNDHEYSDRDSDADVTIRTVALGDTQLAPFDLQPDLAKNTVSALTSELEAALRRLTPPVLRAEQPTFEQPSRSIASMAPRASGRAADARPAARSEARDAGTRALPKDASTASFLALLWVVGGALERLASTIAGRALSLGRAISQHVAGYFTPARRERARSFYRAQYARWNALLARTSTAPAAAWRLLIQRLETRRALSEVSARLSRR
jgi:hypothetical protein